MSEFTCVVSAPDPVWPGCAAVRAREGWEIRQGLETFALVFQLSDGWRCSILGTGAWLSGSADTPQSAVDAARVWLARRYGLPVPLPELEAIASLATSYTQARFPREEARRRVASALAALIGGSYADVTGGRVAAALEPFIGGSDEDPDR